MEQELLILEGKLEQLLALLGRLRGENARLSTRLRVVEDENQQLQEKMDIARTRVEQLIARIPDEGDAAEEEAP